MKRIRVILIPLALFAGFLFIKPPAPSAQNTKIVSKSDTSTTTTSPQTPIISKPNGGKSAVVGGEDEGENDDRGIANKHKEKPKYVGHDDDKYDD